MITFEEPSSTTFFDKHFLKKKELSNDALLFHRIKIYFFNIGGIKMSKTPQCQSCGMPMNKADEFGIETDGSASEKYCIKCYDNGQWTNGEATFDEFYEISLRGFQNSDMNKVQKYFLNKMYTKKFLKKLDRWK